jgi:hypothetical protein
MPWSEDQREKGGLDSHLFPLILRRSRCISCGSGCKNGVGTN